ncbi:MAG: glycogen phosphorylase, partial [Gammaproteobacteria bacterium]|nr:glycogen phosphorylase [Gammaproteobacteria bacterium]
MSTQPAAPFSPSAGFDSATAIAGYDGAPLEFTRVSKALYEHHLVFDKMVVPANATARERFEAFALSVRDVLVRSWVNTESTYARENPKRVYYLSMEFLIGRSLANNVTNLLLDDLASDAVRKMNINWTELLDQEPDAALGNGG